MVNQTGIGLGLSISQSLIKRLNNFKEDAEIKVNSTYLEGSCFFFPLISHEPSEGSSLFNLDTDEKAPGEKQNSIRKFERMEQLEIEVDQTMWKSAPTTRILVVDDDQINILVATQYLKSLDGYEFDVAFDGEQALEKIKHKAEEGYFYDLVLMDCNMPLMDGFKCSRILMSMVRDNLIPKLLIIAATANASPNDREDCFKAGMVDVITKPFHRNELKNKLDTALLKLKKKK